MATTTDDRRTRPADTIGMAGAVGVGQPLVRAVRLLEEQLDAVADVRAWDIGTELCGELLQRITMVSSRVGELQLRIAAQARARQVEDIDGSTSTAGYWSHFTRLNKTTTHRQVRFARALDTDLHEPLQQAVAQGRVLLEQAEVIIDAIEALPAEFVDDQLRYDAQAHLIKEAAEFDAKALRILGRRILEVIAPEVAEAWEAKKLADEEREAEAAASLRMRDDGHGKTHGQFTLPTPVAEMLRKHLQALASPKHRRATGEQPFDPDLPSAHKMGLAFAEFITRYPTDRIPYAGGVSATATVTIPFETLLGGLEAAQLDTGTRISPGLARRWACEAGIVPAVLGGASQVLDLGRKKRFHTEGQRIALGLEQGGCTVQGCDTPAGMCHVHHEWQWKDGGPTDLAHARLLCPRHHARAHDPNYAISKLSGGKITFNRRR